MADSCRANTPRDRLYRIGLLAITDGKRTGGLRNDTGVADLVLQVLLRRLLRTTASYLLQQVWNSRTMLRLLINLRGNLRLLLNGLILKCHGLRL